MTTRTNRETNIHIRARSADRDLIDRAAEVLGKSRSDFVLDTARRGAEEVLRDQRVFELDATRWVAFMEALDNPPKSNPRLRGLFVPILETAITFLRLHHALGQSRHRIPRRPRDSLAIVQYIQHRS